MYREFSCKLTQLPLNVSFLCFLLKHNSLNIFFCTSCLHLFSFHFLLNLLLSGFFTFPSPALPKHLLSRMLMTFILINPMISSCFFFSFDLAAAFHPGFFFFFFPSLTLLVIPSWSSFLPLPFFLCTHSLDGVTSAHGFKYHPKW